MSKSVCSGLPHSWKEPGSQVSRRESVTRTLSGSSGRCSSHLCRLVADAAAAARPVQPLREITDEYAVLWISAGISPERSETPYKPADPIGGLHGLLAACGETQAAFERRCIPPEPPPHRENWRFAALCVAFRSKYTRASSPGGGSSLTRLVSRTPTGRTGPRPHRENWPLSALTRVPPQAASGGFPPGAGAR